ncbi:MAG: 2-oxo acid dehydrogenase subunit E2 [Chloroflexi bacterium]|nr:2-oxo acid dehydrogenase subunit E2 [Chloroflexota bacterium]
MPTPVIMPKLEMSQETAVLIEWLVEEGQPVEKGEPIFEVETDKITVEVESPAGGTIAGLDAQPGDVVPVTTVIAHILAEGESLPLAQPKTQHATRNTPISHEKAPAPAAYSVTPVAQRLADDLGLDISTVVGTGPGGRVTKRDVLKAKGGEGDGETRRAGRLRATPAARRLAREQSLEIGGVAGTGPRGRVQERDVADVVERRLGDEATGWQGDIISTDLPDVRPSVAPLAGMRRAIAQRMTQSWQATPHVTFTVEVDMTAALALRAELNHHCEREGLPKISVTALLVKVCAWALKRHPYVNASLVGEEIHLHPDANIGVAVALETGLIVPVVKRADRLGLAEIAGRVAEISSRARENRLTPEDVSGGTFTISNLGMYRIDHFTAIVNPPQSAILAVGRTVKRQVVVETKTGDELVIRPMMNLTLSADHRVLDGAQAALFLNDLVETFEQPGLMFL